jgi:hypothetical protein
VSDRLRPAPHRQIAVEATMAACIGDAAGQLTSAGGNSSWRVRQEDHPQAVRDRDRDDEQELPICTLVVIDRQVAEDVLNRRICATGRG